MPCVKQHIQGVQHTTITIFLSVCLSVSNPSWQTDEVLEFVMQYEGEVKNLMDFLTGVRESVSMVTTEESACFDTNWTKLREVQFKVHSANSKIFNR